MGRKTIGASSPLLAWTVNTRTPSVSTSMSRLISTSVDFDLGKKIVQRRRFALLMRERQGQEFIDRVGGFGPEPADQRSPAAVLAEQQRIKGKGRKRLGPRRHPSSRRAASTATSSSAAARASSERTAPSRRNFHERVVVKADERRLERAGQRQIIVRQQSRAADRDEIHHRDMVFELEPVGAGGLHIRGLERADHRLEKGVAAANQDHDIAFANAPDFAGIRVDHPLRRGRPQPAL